MLINAGDCIRTCANYRLVWILGRFGGGKTSLAYKIAEFYGNQGYRLLSNNYSIWADDWKDVSLDKNNHLHAVVIWDEGGQYFTDARQIKQIAAYANKMDVIHLIPSYFPPCRAAQVVTIQPQFNLKSAGIPLIVYKWRVRLGGFQDEGNFYWLNPKEIYGVYSRQDPGDTAGELVEYLTKKTEEYRSAYGRERTNNVFEVEESSSQFQVFSDGVEAFQEGVDSLAKTLSKGKRRRR